MTAALSEPIFASLGTALLAIVAMAFGFQVGSAVGTVREWRDEERETEVLEEIVREAQQLEKEEP